MVSMLRVLLVSLVGCATLQVHHRFEAHERRFRDGGVQVTPEALLVAQEHLEELGRRTVLQVGTLVVHPPQASENEFRQWLARRAAEVGGTHFIRYATLQAIERPAWIEEITVHDRDLHEGATHYVVFQVRPSEWSSLPTDLQPPRRL